MVASKAMDMEDRYMVSAILPKVTVDTMTDAIRVILGHAVDAADARVLLEALGIQLEDLVHMRDVRAAG